MCMSFKNTVLGKVHKGLDDARTSMWSKLGFDAIRDPLGEKMGVASKYTNVDSTKKAKPEPADPSPMKVTGQLPQTSGLIIR